MVECLQNISKHADAISDDDDERRGIIMISKGEEHYNIITGNIIKNEKVPLLKQSLELINSLDKEGLSALFKQQIKENTLSEKGGAGLGLIDIAKKTGGKLSYQFKELNPNVSFFILTSTIKRNSASGLDTWHVAVNQCRLSDTEKQELGIRLAIRNPSSS